MNRHIRSILPGLVTWLVAACVLVGWMASTASAQGDEQAPPDPQGIDVDIKGGTKRELIPMAIAPTQASGPGAERIAREVEQTLRTDMDLAGYFKVLSNDGLFFDPDDEELGAEAINFQNWSNVGARALIKSQVKAQEGGKYELVMHLYVVDKGKLQLEESFASTTSEKGHTAAAHEFANKVLAYYTGKEGVFGTRIAFVRRNKAGLKQIWVTDMSGQSVRAITRNNAINLLPSWGKGSLYYTSYQDQNPDLWAWSNGRHRKLSGRRGQNSGAAYCGGKLALTLSMGGENTDIYLIDPESGKQLQRLTDHWAIDTSPTWSPDCSKIAFVSGRSASPQIYVMNADGSNQRRLTYKGTYNTTPEWSPRGDVIAFTSRDERSAFDIFTVDLEGSIDRLTQDQGDNEDPSWSPDGRYMVFASDREGGKRLWIMTADGQYQRPITEGGGYSSPAWSR